MEASFGILLRRLRVHSRHRFFRCSSSRSSRPFVPKLRALPTFISGDENTPRYPGEVKSLSDAIAELNVSDLKPNDSIDIGFSERLERNPAEYLKRQAHVRQKKSNYDLEKAARQRTFKIPLEDVHCEWLKRVAPLHIKQIAEHYGIFDDLFHGAHFLPRVLLDILYTYNEALSSPVYRGNHIKPSEAVSAPEVRFEADPDSLWTLVLTNLDGHFHDNSAEYLHWFVGNISGSSVEKGEVICDYMQPFPPKGTGFHRFVFVLYKQEGRLDYSPLKRNLPCFRLEDRTFRTLDFYKQWQDVLTPAGLAFFQCDYDETLTRFFHETLKMREPLFEYDFPPPYIRPQKAKPEGKPFNLYLDKYRDSKDIGKEILLKRFKLMHPFEGEAAKPKYPNIHHLPREYPSWLKTETKKERFRIGKYRDMDVEIFKPERPTRVVFGKFSAERATMFEDTLNTKKG